jgi:hypothetical protein
VNEPYGLATFLAVLFAGGVESEPMIVREYSCRIFKADAMLGFIGFIGFIG